MKHHTVTSYQEELNDISHSCVKMSKLLIDILQLQKKAMQDFGGNYILKSQEIDELINKCDSHIENTAMIVLATRQPLAIDLRFVLSSIKLAVIMERMGDLSKNIIRRSGAVTSQIPTSMMQDIDQMNDTLLTMQEKIVRSLKTKDDQLALKVIDEDAKIDAKYSSFMTKLSEMKLNKNENLSNHVQLVIACKNIERLGDYIVKLAKILYFINSGKKIF